MRGLLRVLIASGVICSGTACLATNFACGAGPINYLGMDANGVVQLSFSNVSFIDICSVNATFAGVGADVCKAWYSTLLTQRAQGKSMVMYFDSTNPSNAGIITCQALGPWTVRPPYFIEPQP